MTRITRWINCVYKRILIIDRLAIRDRFLSQNQFGDGHWRHNGWLRCTGITLQYRKVREKKVTKNYSGLMMTTTCLSREWRQSKRMTV